MSRSASDRHAILALLAGTLALPLLGCLAHPTRAGQTERAAATRPPAIVDLRVGFQGHYKVGFWTPVELVCRGGSQDAAGHVDVTVPDGDGVPCQVTARAVLPKNATTRLVLYVKFGRRDGYLTASLRPSRQASLSRTFQASGAPGQSALPRALPSRQRLILAIGPPIGLDEVLARQGGDSVASATIVQLPDPSRLPVRWLGYDGVDLLVISGSSDQRASTVDSQRLAALIDWIELGGGLLLTTGETGRSSLEPGGPWSSLVPAQMGSPVRLPRTGELEAFSGTTVHLPRTGIRGRQGLEVIRLSNVQGVVEAAEGDLPLVVTSPRAFGTITFVPFDLAREPIAGWLGRPQLLERLLGDSTRRSRDDDSRSAKGPAGYLGITDLSGQLRGALDQFPGVRLIPFWVVAVSAAVYILLIGPADYFLLKRFDALPATWVTFPLLVILFSAGAYFAAFAAKGERARVNQLELVDADLASGRIRGTAWASVFSPQTTSYTFSLEPPSRSSDAAGVNMLFSWHGLPGAALGGMEPAAPAPGVIAGPYQMTARLEALRGVPIPIWSSKNFVGRWHGRGELGLAADLSADNDDVVEGTITSRLDVSLSECLLVSGRWIWLIGELASGQSIDISPGDQRDLQSVLKAHRLIRQKNDQLVQVATPYNPAGLEVPPIVEQMMFYEALGGAAYSSLLNRYDDFVDLSSHLHLRRAVLVGAARAPRPQAPLCSDGRPLAGTGDRHWTFFRFVIPLAPLKESPL